MSLWCEFDCTASLESKPRGSVLYAHVAKPDLAKIAHGLSFSGVSFLWVHRPDKVSSIDADLLPEGFVVDVVFPD